MYDGKGELFVLGTTSSKKSEYGTPYPLPWMKVNITQKYPHRLDQPGAFVLKVGRNPEPPPTACTARFSKSMTLTLSTTIFDPQSIR